MPATLLTFEYVNSLLHYDPEAGIFYWKNNAGIWGRIKAGSVAGTTDRAQGYVKINIDNTPRLAHRLAWLLYYGKFPAHQIDHINGIRNDNRIANLRQATNGQNSRNRGAQSNNKTGMKGVTLSPAGGYFARIKVDGVDHYLGYFIQLGAAKAAYDRACIELHGPFSRTS